MSEAHPAIEDIVSARPVPPLRPAPPAGLEAAALRGRRTVKAYPEEHWAAVATAYRRAVSARRQPGLEISRLFGVPVTTAYGWIVSSRRYGHLEPSGRQGLISGLPCNHRCPHCCKADEETR